MKKLLGLAVAGVFLAGTAGSALAEDEGPHFSFGAAASYAYDINDPDPNNNLNVTENNKALGNLGDGSSNPGDESFNIDLIQLGMTGSRGPVSYSVKLDFGDLAQQVDGGVGSGGTVDAALQEAFLAVDVHGLTVTAGRMPTPIGYEVLEPWGNTQISRSRAWTFQPINHDGLAVSATTGNVSGMVGIVNGFGVSDKLGFNNVDDEYGFIGSVGANFGDIDTNLSAIYSEEADAANIFEVNGIASAVIGNCNAALEVTYLNSDAKNSAGSNALGGPLFGTTDVEFLDFTGYFDTHIGPWTLGARASVSDEQNASAFADPTRSVTGNLNDTRFTLSLTAGYEITEGVIVRSEYRLETANKDVFGDDDFAGSGGGDDQLNVLQAQIIWMP